MRILTDYQGRRVRLTDERLAHIREHPEMVGLESSIARTLSEPEKVIQSSSDLAAELFFVIIWVRASVTSGSASSSSFEWTMHLW